jgi:hypothetical protein
MRLLHGKEAKNIPKVVHPLITVRWSRLNN